MLAEMTHVTTYHLITEDREITLLEPSYLFLLFQMPNLFPSVHC